MTPEPAYLKACERVLEKDFADFNPLSNPLNHPFFTSPFPAIHEHIEPFRLNVDLPPAVVARIRAVIPAARLLQPLTQHFYFSLYRDLEAAGLLHYTDEASIRTFLTLATPRLSHHVKPN